MSIVWKAFPQRLCLTGERVKSLHDQFTGAPLRWFEQEVLGFTCGRVKLTLHRSSPEPLRVIPYA